MFLLRVKGLWLRWQYLPWREKLRTAAVCTTGAMAGLYLILGGQGLPRPGDTAPPHAFLRDGAGVSDADDVGTLLRRRAALLAPFTYPQLYPECSRVTLPPPVESRAEMLELQRSQAGEDLLLYDEIFKDDHPLGGGGAGGGGAFLEIGALDGEKFSNTYLFEKALGWRGILVEAHPDNAAALMQSDRPRSARFGPVAACEGEGDDRPGHMTFSEGGGEVATARDLSTRRFQEE